MPEEDAGRFLRDFSTHVWELCDYGMDAGQTTEHQSDPRKKKKKKTSSESTFNQRTLSQAPQSVTGGTAAPRPPHVTLIH